MRDAFEGHPAPTVSGSNVNTDLPQTEADYPATIIKFYEREMPNAGVGHYEMLPNPADPGFPDNVTSYIKYYHRMYKGDIEFAIYALSAPDRDIMRDALIEVLAMQDVTDQGNAFLQRLYYDLNDTPYGAWHYPVLNLDLITGYGEQESQPGWAPEDRLIYQVTYRVPIFGEFYSNTPAQPSGIGLLAEVDVYPWIPDIDKAPTHPPLGGDPNSVSGGYYKFTGWQSTPGELWDGGDAFTTDFAEVIDGGDS
jgi:hypothetical protein